LKLFSYVISRDYGFAPNPYGGFCTLATCKPEIRRSANIGDWIVGFGSVKTVAAKKLVYAMKISEKMTFDQYWVDPRFSCKKPVFTKSRRFCYGDNIYHHNENQDWIQENSHHSNLDGTINMLNLNRDTKTNAVLISNNYFYWGNNACDIPETLKTIYHPYIGHKTCSDEALINDFVIWIQTNFELGKHGSPFSLGGNVSFIHYSGN
jgi:hypothetical protein